jgi:predicted DNA-binding protein
MTIRSDGRRVISVTMQPDLYDQLYARCKELDRPITVFVREAISQALNAEQQRILATRNQASWTAISPDPSTKLNHE